MIKKALSLQRTTSLYIFGNSEGQPYITCSSNTDLRRLMAHADAKARKEGIAFEIHPEGHVAGGGDGPSRRG